jgi:tRNA threonylcarbamoyladenosine biosynthesis protein TsaE
VDGVANSVQLGWSTNQNIPCRVKAFWKQNMLFLFYLTSMKKILLNSQSEMIAFAKEIAADAQSHAVIGLKGTLGAGKSFFARHFINSLQEKPSEILSPTFNLVYSYSTKKGEVFHFDLYRLKSASELENIGFFEALRAGICLIEWPEIAADFLGKNYLEIEIKTAASLGEEVRKILLKKGK